MARWSFTLALLLIAAGFAPRGSAAAAEAKKIRLGILQTGSQDFVHTVMEARHLLQKHNIPYERVQSLNPPALHIMIAEKSVGSAMGSLSGWFGTVMLMRL